MEEISGRFHEAKLRKGGCVDNPRINQSYYNRAQSGKKFPCIGTNVNRCAKRQTLLCSPRKDIPNSPVAKPISKRSAEGRLIRCDGRKGEPAIGMSVDGRRRKRIIHRVDLSSSTAISQTFGMFTHRRKDEGQGSAGNWESAFGVGTELQLQKAVNSEAMPIRGLAAVDLKENAHIRTRNDRGLSGSRKGECEKRSAGVSRLLAVVDCEVVISLAVKSSCLAKVGFCLSGLLSLKGVTPKNLFTEDGEMNGSIHRIQGRGSGLTGLEPAASALTGRCSDRLNYNPRKGPCAVNPLRAVVRRRKVVSAKLSGRGVVLCDLDSPTRVLYEYAGRGAPRAPKRFLFWASSVLLSIGPMHWAHFIEVGCQAKVVLLLFAALICDHPSLPGIVPHRKKERRAPTCRSANVKRGVEPELAN
ncbi:hypothetical protein Droror1_Dr00028131 [Drosera rotundifolia]